MIALIRIGNQTRPFRQLPRLTRLAASLVMVAVATSFAKAAPADPGEKVFQEKCVACHTLGEGKRVGPDLKGVTERREAEWLRRMIKDPEGMVASGDPVAKQLLAEYNNVPMTNQNLSDADVSAVLAYLTQQSSAASAVAAPTATQAAPKSERRRPARLSKAALQGRDLFWGAKGLAKGAPACGTCHTAGQKGLLIGGKLGPDLTGAFDKFGDAGLAGILAAPPYPTMIPIYSKRALTPAEQASLKVYLEEVGGRPSQLPTVALLIGGVAGFVVLLILVQVLWRRRLGPVREALLWQTPRP